MELILADTSIWVDHIRASNPNLIDLIRKERLVVHPLVIGEVVLGNLPRWETTLAWLRGLPSVQPVSDEELYRTIAQQALQGSGLGVVDAHLLGAVLLRPELRLWSRDRRLSDHAKRMDRSWLPPDSG